MRSMSAIMDYFGGILSVSVSNEGLHDNINGKKWIKVIVGSFPRIISQLFHYETARY